MTTTTYYNLNIVEGTDVVNPLTVDNPNYETIDEAMHDNAVAGVTFATEITNATVHAIARENSDCAVIRFIATSEWKAGDTVTVDGVPVTALLPSGETLPDGAYVINANVLCILTGTNLTFYLGTKKARNANEITYNDTNVGAELDRLNASLQETDSNLTASDNTPFRFGVDSEGKYGYIVTNEVGADTVIPFKSGIDIANIVKYYNYASSAPGTSCSTSLTLSNGKYIIIAEGFFGTSDKSYTSINSLSLKVGETEKGTSAKSIVTGSINYEGALAAASKYLICDIDESTTVTASYESNTHGSYPKAAHVALWAFKLE